MAPASRLETSGSKVAPRRRCDQARRLVGCGVRLRESLDFGGTLGRVESRTSRREDPRRPFRSSRSLGSCWRRQRLARQRLGVVPRHIAGGDLLGAREPLSGAELLGRPALPIAPGYEEFDRLVPLICALAPRVTRDFRREIRAADKLAFVRLARAPSRPRARGARPSLASSPRRTRPGPGSRGRAA